jgi:hypothetical protein
VLRLEGAITGADLGVVYDTLRGEPAAVMGVTYESRESMSRGRLGEFGGGSLLAALEQTSNTQKPIPLPDDTQGIAAVFDVTPLTEISDMLLDVSALLEREDGAQYTIDFGTVPFDGEGVELQGFLPEGASRTGLSIVAFEFTARVGNPAMNGLTTETITRVVARDVRAIGVETSDEEIPMTPVKVNVASWHATGHLSDTEDFPRSYMQEGWQAGYTRSTSTSRGCRLANCQR